MVGSVCVVCLLAVTTTADTANSVSRDALRELQRCVFAFRDLRGAQALADCSAYEGIPEHAESYAQCMSGWMNATERLATAQADVLGCKDTPDLERRYFEATRDAARSGDVDAQLCYLQGEFGSLATRPLTAADLAEYEKVAPGYVDAAFKRGDWRIVSLLNRRHFHPGSGPVTLLEGIGQRQTQYRMTRLLRLGASGSYGAFLDSHLDGMKRAPLNPELALPQDIVTKSDAWAQQTYTDYFSSTPALTRDPIVCVPLPRWLPDQ